MINSFIVDISKDGIRGSGGVFGTFSPSMGGSDSSNPNVRSDISVREIKVGQTVSALTNPDFLMPVVFGSDKVLIWINRKLFIPDIDYQVRGVKVTWLNTNVSITPTDEIILWGPTNNSTAELITFEYFKIRDTSVYTGSQLILNGGVSDNLLYPFNQDSTYLFVNGDCITPNDKYTYDSIGNRINLVDALNPATDKVFAFYYNLKPSADIRLGEALVRTKKTDGVVNIPLFKPDNKDLKEESQVFLNGGRAVYGKNYRINYPLLKWDNSKGLSYSSGHVLDISYFSDVKLTVDVFSTSYTFQSSTTLNASPITQQLGFHYVNGILSTPPLSDNEVSISNRDYNISGQTLEWIGLPAVTPGYAIRYEGFADIYSKQSIGIVTKTDSTTPTPLPEAVAPTKVIAWKHGVANFSQFNDFTISSGLNKELSFSTTSASDRIQVMYFKQANYSDLWNFEPSVQASGIAANQKFSLNHAAKSLNTCWVFVNGVKLYPGVHYVLEEQSSKVRILNSYPGANTKLMFVYI